MRLLSKICFICYHAFLVVCPKGDENQEDLRTQTEHTIIVLLKKHIRGIFNELTKNMGKLSPSSLSDLCSVLNNDISAYIRSLCRKQFATLRPLLSKELELLELPESYVQVRGKARARIESSFITDTMVFTQQILVYYFTEHIDSVKPRAHAGLTCANPEDRSPISRKKPCEVIISEHMRSLWNGLERDLGGSYDTVLRYSFYNVYILLCKEVNRRTSNRKRLGVVLETLVAWKTRLKKERKGPVDHSARNNFLGIVSDARGYLYSAICDRHCEAEICVCKIQTSMKFALRRCRPAYNCWHLMFLHSHVSYKSRVNKWILKKFKAFWAPRRVKRI